MKIIAWLEIITTWESVLKGYIALGRLRTIDLGYFDWDCFINILLFPISIPVISVLIFIVYFYLLLLLLIGSCFSTGLGYVVWMLYIILYYNALSPCILHCSLFWCWFPFFFPTGPHTEENFNLQCTSSLFSDFPHRVLTLLEVI